SNDYDAIVTSHGNLQNSESHPLTGVSFIFSAVLQSVESAKQKSLVVSSEPGVTRLVWPA
ncbi:MAG: hypothetical protein P8L78_18830, partial [Mariniblastus sp.]|nr:hypothetical protein [Mariniblastus sp.]MDG2183753.1 hypothetical protein [Mariniblastus sp.]